MKYWILISAVFSFLLLGLDSRRALAGCTPVPEHSFGRVTDYEEGSEDDVNNSVTGSGSEMDGDPATFWNNSGKAYRFEGRDFSLRYFGHVWVQKDGGEVEVNKNKSHSRRLTLKTNCIPGENHVETPPGGNSWLIRSQSNIKIDLAGSACNEATFSRSFSGWVRVQTAAGGDHYVGQDVLDTTGDNEQREESTVGSSATLGASGEAGKPAQVKAEVTSSSSSSITIIRRTQKATAVNISNRPYTKEDRRRTETLCHAGDLDYYDTISTSGRGTLTSPTTGPSNTVYKLRWNLFGSIETDVKARVYQYCGEALPVSYNEDTWPDILDFKREWDGSIKRSKSVLAAAAGGVGESLAIGFQHRQSMFATSNLIGVDLAEVWVESGTRQVFLRNGASSVGCLTIAASHFRRADGDSNTVVELEELYYSGSGVAYAALTEGFWYLWAEVPTVESGLATVEVSFTEGFTESAVSEIESIENWLSVEFWRVGVHNSLEHPDRMIRRVGLAQRITLESLVSWDPLSDEPVFDIAFDQTSEGDEVDISTLTVQRNTVTGELEIHFTSEDEVSGLITLEIDCNDGVFYIEIPVSVRYPTPEE